jgi:replicative DNA helicase
MHAEVGQDSLSYTHDSPLLFQLQHLLLRFGILSKVVDTKLSVLSLKTFAISIGLTHHDQALSHYETIEEPFFPATQDILWEKIISLTPSGLQPVFDLTVPYTHNFIAADLIVHNTALAINFAEHICFQNHLPVAIFSLEMSASQLLHRIISSQSEVESEKILTGSLNGTEYQRIVQAANRIERQTLIIDDQPGLKVTDLRARARRLKESHNIGFIVIDYLQLLSGPNNHRSQENRQMEISEISRMLKNLARELNIPVLCAAQLSRKVEERQGHRPMMSDLRESGSLEQDSDIIMFLLRRDYYDPYDKPGMAEVIVAKNRHGATGSVHLTFRKEIGQFANYSPNLSPSSPKNHQEAFAPFSPV